MTLSDYVALWPKIQGAFSAAGVDISLTQALAIYPTVAALVKNATPAPAPSGPALPATLTLGGDANLAPYGVALVGFSPQEHQGANLRDAAQAKYIAYAYLVANAILPSSSWAPAAAAFLASIVPSVPWQAADGETLVYGDEYIHVAPRGWGDPTLLHRDDLNAQEFFWGSFGG